MMDVAGARAVFYSRNRYAAWPERFFIGMHGDHLHLTHHLLPGIPHWNLAAATEILREDPAFCEWDKAWGGILTTQSPERMSLLKYIVNIHEFTPVFRRPILQLRGAQ
jgi:fatty acid desaturase